MNSIKKIMNKNIKFNNNMNMGSILHNRIVLYIFVFMAIVDLMFFAIVGDIRSLFTLIIIGFLTSFFSKNMIVILFISLTLTHILKYGTNVSEGMESKMPIDNSGNIIDNSGNIIDNSGNIVNNLNVNEPMSDLEPDKINKKNDGKKSDGKKNDNKEVDLQSLQKDFHDFQSIQEKILNGIKEIDPLLTKAENFIEKFEHYKTIKNGGEPTDDD